MNNQQLYEKFSELSTPLIADACLRLKISLRLAPSGIHPLTIESHIAGKVLPVRHYGSMDIFLEVMGAAHHGDILVIDNEGRMDEGCIGDLTVLEAKASGLAGISSGVAIATLWNFIRSAFLSLVMAPIPRVHSDSLNVILKHGIRLGWAIS
jgi:regulator of RNase E activity RraA